MSFMMFLVVELWLAGNPLEFSGHPCREALASHLFFCLAKARERDRNRSITFVGTATYADHVLSFQARFGVSCSFLRAAFLCWFIAISFQHESPNRTRFR